MDFYHSGMRELQDRYEGRSVADRLASNRMRSKFNDEDRQCIETSSFFFLATSSADNVDCSFKGGVPGFVRVVGENVVTWPDYDGNRMYRSLGNMLHNPRVGLLFIRFDGKLFNNAGRLRVNGHAEIDESPEVIAGLPGARLAALLGNEASGLSASTIARLKEVWVDEHRRWNERDLSAKRYVYMWADGIHLQARLEEDAQCILVIIGATPEGKKELVGFTDGTRESAHDWRALLLDLKRRGLSIAPEVTIAGD